LRIILEQKEEATKWSVIDMKIIGISLLMMACLMGFSLGIDMLQGFDVSQAFYNALSPFRVMELAELFVLFSLIFLFFVESLYLFMKKKNQSK
jgi:cytochrome bd-type quinol oxidase subunit 2